VLVALRHVQNQQWLYFFLTFGVQNNYMSEEIRKMFKDIGKRRNMLEDIEKNYIRIAVVNGGNMYRV
jgi:hypothetical protein